MAKAPRTPGKQGGQSGRRTARELKTRVKTARGRKLSSTLWLERQLNDPFVARARREGYRSRAAYKLIGIDDKRTLLRPGLRVVDLGCAPGGWAQVAATRTRSDPDHPTVIGIDYLPVDEIPGVLLLQKDFTDPEAPEMLLDALGAHKAGLLLSDMAAPATGHRPTDHLRIMHLVELAAEFATKVLEQDGAFVAKVLQGGTEHQLLAGLKRHFASTSHVKPPASRTDSAETYLVAKGFRG